MNTTLDTSADILAQNRILYGGYGYGGNGYGHGSGISTDTNARAVLNANLQSGIDRVVDNQRFSFDAMTAQNDALANTAAEFRESDRFALLNANLTANFNQIDRRFSDMALKQQECCCELRAGQATLLAKIECNDAVKAAEDRATSNAKLDIILASQNGRGHGNG